MFQSRSLCTHSNMFHPAEGRCARADFIYMLCYFSSSHTSMRQQRTPMSYLYSPGITVCPRHLFMKMKNKIKRRSLLRSCCGCCCCWKSGIRTEAMALSCCWRSHRSVDLHKYVVSGQRSFSIILVHCTCIGGVSASCPLSRLVQNFLMEIHYHAEMVISKQHWSDSEYVLDVCDCVLSHLCHSLEGRKCLFLVSLTNLEHAMGH